MDEHQEIWGFLDRHLTAIFNGDWATYATTTAADLSLYEYWIIPHRQDGLDFHKFMIENRWTGKVEAQRYDLFEKRCQRYGDTAVVTYTLMLSQAGESGIRHRTHNESRTIVKIDGEWRVVHVHKSPSSWPLSGDGH
ncbi:MAG: nuclear transport factor 2 family protein [Burkholderiales bacterium]|nr:nuclear transport factor 2 family protein [Anaerolineae bacterium]